MKKKMLLMLLLVICAPWFAQGQVTPDDRYSGYTGPAIVWPTTPSACGGKEYYEPKFTSLYDKMVNVAGSRVQVHDECPWMYTISGWAWALRRAGTKVAIDAKGRDLFDLGRADGKVCGNPRMTPPPSASPPVVPPTGLVHVKKLVFDPEGRSMPLPTGAVKVLIGDQQVPLNVSGEGELKLAVGQYDVIEEFDEMVWQQTYISSAQVNVEAGKTINIEVKNQQRRPPAQPVTKESVVGTPACVVNGSPETGFTGTAYNGVGVWIGDGQTLAIPGDERVGLEPGQGAGLRTLILRVTGPGGTAECKRTWEIPSESAFTLEMPPTARGRPLWSKFPVLNCGYQLIPGLGGFKRHGAWDIVEKVGCAAGIAGGIYAGVTSGAAAAIKVAACVPTMLPNGTWTVCAH